MSAAKRDDGTRNRENNLVKEKLKIELEALVLLITSGDNPNHVNLLQINVSFSLPVLS